MSDILFRLQDFDNHGNTASERLLMRKEAYDEIAHLRDELLTAREVLAEMDKLVAGLRERNAEMLAALELLVADVAPYEAWQRPCHALTVANEVIAKATGAAS
jgi:hypothetical protein